MDEADELCAQDGSFYQLQVGVLCWIVELGRVVIQIKVSLLASQVACPREGHLGAFFGN